MIFGKSRRDFERLENRVDDLEKANKALLAAYDSSMDWLAKELGLCVRKTNYYQSPTGGVYHSSESAFPASPREFATKPQPPVAPELARCPNEPKKEDK